MKLPILVYEPCTLDMFDSVEAAELYHEEWIWPKKTWPFTMPAA